MAKEWRYTINIPPMGTPRPRHKFLDDGRKITYYDQSYIDYMNSVQEQLKRDGALNDNFFDVIHTYLGVKAEIIFYCQAPKTQKRLNKLTKTTAPDIDNLLKAALDSIFKGLDEKDSCVSMVTMAKFQEMNNPRTEIVFRGIE